MVLFLVLLVVLVVLVMLVVFVVEFIVKFIVVEFMLVALIGQPKPPHMPQSRQAGRPR